MTRTPNYIRLAIGIDVSKDRLAVCSCQLSSDLKKDYDYLADVPNTAEGFSTLESWIARQSGYGSMPVLVVMEATGVYHEALAGHFYRAGMQVSIMHAGRVKRYAQSLKLRSKTDLIDSQVLALLGVEREPDLWSPPSALLAALKSLSRERGALVRRRSRERNLDHADHSREYSCEAAKRRTDARIALLNEQIASIEGEMRELISGNEELNQKMAYLRSIPGVSFVSAVTVVAETLGFKDIKTGRQLVSYAGYDVILRESGAIKGRSRISKRGNSRIREVLHMPSMTAVRCNPTLRPFYLRLKASKSKPLIGLVAVQRKLLHLMFTLWRSETYYDAGYLSAQG